MSAPQLVEKTRKMVVAQIKAHIAAQLAAIRVDRNDPVVNVVAPKSYFVYDGAHTFECPAIFTVIDSGEIPEDRTGANHVQAVIKMFVSAVVEDREADKLTILSERYQAALFECLHWQNLVDQTANIKLWVRVQRFKFGDLYTRTRKQDNMAVFRKEVALELEIKIYENPNT